jgi:hypothetical protein
MKDMSIRTLEASLYQLQTGYTSNEAQFGYIAVRIEGG